MNAKEYLSRANHIDNIINAKLKELEDLRHIATALGGFSDSERVQTSKKLYAQYTRTIEKIVDLECEITREIDRYVDIKREISETIGKVEDAEERIVLDYKYLCNMNWEEIGQKLEVHPRTVMRRHDRGLSVIQKVCSSI